MQEVTLSSFILCIDVIHSEFEHQSFLDYIKSNYKKDFIFINAQDYTESSGRSSRNENRHSSKSYSSNTAIIKGIKNKINTEYQKLLDAKRRYLIQLEKKMHQAQKSSNSGRNSRHSTLPTKHEETKLYGGEAEVIFCIVNYPYSASQVNALRKSGVDLGSFIALVKQGDIQEDQVFEEKISGRTSSKKPIKGSQFDISLNPRSVPPARWASLRPESPPDIIFAHVEAANTMVESWHTLEENIGRIIKARKSFIAQYGSRKFINIPVSTARPDMHTLMDYLKYHPNDFCNGMFYQLKKAEWKLARPQPVPSVKEMYSNIFKKYINDSVRENVKQNISTPEIKPLSTVSYPLNLFYYLKDITNWELHEEDAEMTRHNALFFSEPLNFYAAAGQRFEALYALTNKKYCLGLPSSVFEWSKWNYMRFYENITDQLTKAIQKSLLVETYFDKVLGILWVMAMTPITKAIGQPCTVDYMPPALDGSSEFLSKIYDIEFPQLEKRPKAPPTPSSLLKKEGTASSLFPPIVYRLGNEEDPIYKISSEIGSSFYIVSPFLFETGLQVNIERNIINDLPTFSYEINYINGIKVHSTRDSINIFINQYLRLHFLNNNYTIAHKDNVILSNGNELIFKSGNDQSFTITYDGSIAFDQEGPKFLTRSGIVGRKIKDNWQLIHSDGNEKTYDNSGKKINSSTKLFLNEIGSIYTKMIIEGPIEYRIGKTDRIITFGTNIIIHQYEDHIEYKLPHFPPIIWKENHVEIKYDSCNFICNSSSFETAHDEMKINFSDSILKVITPNDESILDPKLCQVKVGEKILFSDSEGNERFGLLDLSDTPQKKNIQLIVSHWGRVAQIKETRIEADHSRLHEIFNPRFFAVNSDLSGAEFLSSSFIPFKEHVKKETEVSSRLDCESNDTLSKLRSSLKTLTEEKHEELKIITLHQQHKKPLAYFEFKPIDKLAKSSLMKGYMAKPPRVNKRMQKDPIEVLMSEANANVETYRKMVKKYSRIINQVLEENEKQYLIDIQPKAPPPPPKVFPPIFTPPPRILQAQSEKYAVKKESVPLLSYWDSPECNFAIPLDIPHEPAQPLSPRTKLFDMPDPNRNRFDPPPIDPESLPKYDKPASTNRVYRTEVSRPQTSHYDDQIDFGVVRLGSKVLRTMKVHNTTTRPMKYFILPSDDPSFEFLTVSGVISPGLTLIIKIRLNATKVQRHSSSFKLKTKDYEKVISLVGKVIEQET